MRTTLVPFLAVAAACAGLVAPACANDASCDEGQKVVQGACFTLPPDQASAGQSGESGAAGVGGAGGGN